LISSLGCREVDAILVKILSCDIDDIIACGKAAISFRNGDYKGIKGIGTTEAESIQIASKREA
jgi:hypothetical protein